MLPVRFAEPVSPDRAVGFRVDKDDDLLAFRDVLLGPADTLLDLSGLQYPFLQVDAVGPDFALQLALVLPQARLSIRVCMDDAVEQVNELLAGLHGFHQRLDHPRRQDHRPHRVDAAGLQPFVGHLLGFRGVVPFWPVDIRPLFVLRPIQLGPVHPRPGVKALDRGRVAAALAVPSLDLGFDAVEQPGCLQVSCLGDVFKRGGSRVHGESCVTDKPFHSLRRSRVGVLGVVGFVQQQDCIRSVRPLIPNTGVGNEFNAFQIVLGQVRADLPNQFLILGHVDELLRAAFAAFPDHTAQDERLSHAGGRSENEDGAAFCEGPCHRPDVFNLSVEDELRNVEFGPRGDQRLRIRSHEPTKFLSRSSSVGPFAFSSSVALAFHIRRACATISQSRSIASPTESRSDCSRWVLVVKGPRLLRRIVATS